MGVGLDQPSHWAVIAVLFLLLFGYKKLPEMARSAGKSMRVFKTELKGMAEDDDARAGHKAETVAGPAEVASPPAAALPAPPVATLPVPPVATLPAPSSAAGEPPASAPVAPAPPVPAAEPVVNHSPVDSVTPRTS